ncbi:50S ribosomal protein L21 [candidate division KSB1 bacterium]|nr:50S ribosomal protein L21 [candidate division KSB1 bacterium]NIR68813.1 50S ribosomal protein L21 [candidate division KSB1 bacterium]NIS27176.1 50S ribosomal protein L21 [candidate division KSB1 bacterium]NIT74061.1 50S ribosomal protein L21 [candidate division KSB1 bacterium]NIU26926.1 50S ribosomal protein L21 [candidate division KSB1 bacterium]
MYAIVDIGGKQFKVSKNDKIVAPKIVGKAGKDVDLDRVLLISDKGKVTVGKPVVKGASVKAKILVFERGRKVTVFKKKRRKGYQIKKGHRQDYTSLMIKSIKPKTK